MPTETPTETLDLSQRVDAPELMDTLCSFEEYQQCITGLTVVNRLVMAYRPTFDFLNRVLAASPDLKRPLRILDVGCGDGDLLRQIGRWAERRGVRVELQGIDLNPLSARAARKAEERETVSAPVEYITGDVMDYRPSVPVDVVLSTHLTHHLNNSQIVRLLEWMEVTAARGWFISDLHRHAVPFHLFNAIARVLRWHTIVREDGLASIRRSFSPSDWSGLCQGAGLPLDGVVISWFMPFRLCVRRIR